MLLSNGAMMKDDVIQSFRKSVYKNQDVPAGWKSTEFWNFVQTDMYMDLGNVYASSYIDECFDTLAESLQ